MSFEDMRDLDIVMFDVTQDDIDNGDRLDTCSCPIALAINRSFGIPIGSSYVLGTKFYIQIDDPDAPENYVQFEHSYASGEFINAFDKGGDVQPLTLTLRRRTYVESD